MRVHRPRRHVDAAAPPPDLADAAHDDSVARVSRVAGRRDIEASTRWSRLSNARTLAGAVLLLLAAHGAAHAATYRCEVGGRVLYRDTPCEVGRQSSVAVDDPVAPADRAAAVDRARSDRTALARLDRDRARERDEDRKAAVLARRDHSDRNKQVQACAKLARRARDAHDRFDIAGPRDQPAARLKMQHADADFAAFCKR